MRTQMTDGRILRASLCEIERGLFFLAYNVNHAGKHLLPRYQVGTSAADAKQEIERRARECGYELVIWEAGLTDPVTLPSPATEATRRSY